MNGRMYGIVRSRLGLFGGLVFWVNVEEKGGGGGGGGIS